LISSKELFERFEASAAGRKEILRAWGGETLTGDEALLRVRSCARALSREGIGKGDIVLLRGLAGIPLVIGILAVWSQDAVMLATEPSLPDPQIEGLCDTFAPRALMVAAASGPTVHPRRVVPSSRLALPGGVAVIKLTSGSTGRPRGIAVGAGHLLTDGLHIAGGLGIGAEDVNVGVVPGSHSYGLGNLILPLVLQGTPLLFADPLPAGLAEALSLGEPLVFPGVPALYEMLARLPPSGIRPAGLRLCLSAGAPLRPATAIVFRERYGIPVRVLYGASECGGISYDASPEGRGAEQTDAPVGTPIPGVQLRIAPEDGRVEVKSGAVAHGYVSGAASPGDGEFAGEWFRTGDTGRIDPEGNLVLTGRIGSLINVAGRKVNPAEVESALLLVPGVGEAVVMGVPDASRGEMLLACLVAKEEMSRESVMAHLRVGLADYKLPRRVVFLRSIPHNERGKIDREALLRAVAEAGIPSVKA
jgi:acyl-CoA synthetase (AMP-forming)/AMP-acid ligase II